MTYPLTFYTDNLETWQAGCAIGPIIKIRIGYEADIGLYQHELTHVKQFAWPALIGTLLGLAAAAAFPALSAVWPGDGAVLGLSLGAMFHPLAYLWVRRYRLWAEAQAYGVQMNYPDRYGGKLSLDNAAYRLTLPNYKLGITLDEAKARLMGQGAPAPL